MGRFSALFLLFICTCTPYLNRTGADLFIMVSLPPVQVKNAVPICKIPLNLFQCWNLPIISKGFIANINGQGVMWLSSNDGEHDSCYVVFKNKMVKGVKYRLKWWKKDAVKKKWIVSSVKDTVLKTDYDVLDIVY